MLAGALRKGTSVPRLGGEDTNDIATGKFLILNNLNFLSKSMRSQDSNSNGYFSVERVDDVLLLL